jgi:NAD(P)-dependent dehydrogenase (short-subunit alcohol dehydrogenase family)
MDDPTRRSGRVWFITGAGRGLGRAFAQSALNAGDRVVAATRTTAVLDDLAAQAGERLLVLPLDVTDREAVFTAVDTAVQHFGRLDIVVNNAGILVVGMVEEFTEAEARAQLETNFLGALWVSQAVVPVLRAQGSGHIVQISSIGGLGGFPTTALYSASKFALEGMSEALAMEVAPFGVRLTIVQPGGYWTDLYRSMRSTTPLEAYAPLRAAQADQLAENSVDSEPHLAAEALMKVVDSDDPPLRVVFGSMVYDLAFELTRQRMKTWAGWEDVSRAAEHAVPEPAGASNVGGRQDTT